MKIVLVAALFICLVGSATAKTEQDLRNFLDEDKTEKIAITNNFTTKEAAETVKDNAAAAGFSCRVVEIEYEDGFKYWVNEFDSNSGGLTVSCRGAKDGSGIDKQVIDPIVDGKTLRIKCLSGTCPYEYGHKDQNDKLVKVLSHQYIDSPTQGAAINNGPAEVQQIETARPVITLKCGKSAGNLTPTSATIITQPSTIQSRTSSSIVQVNGISTEIAGEAAGEAVGKINQIINSSQTEKPDIVIYKDESSEIQEDEIKPEGVVCKTGSCEVPEEDYKPAENKTLSDNVDDYINQDEASASSNKGKIQFVMK